MKQLALLTLAVFVFASPAFGADKSDASQAKQKAPTEKQSVTHGTVTVEGHRVRYKAVAGILVLKNNDEKPTATMSYTAYFKDGVDDESKRPITFMYNGGPGSSTMWLHMGSFGPVRVAGVDAGERASAPYKLVNNDYSLLDVSDVVFIDMPSTGFGRIIGKDEGGAGQAKDFFGIDQDASAFAQFITEFLSKYQRWNSPKYLFGESYGTTRSAVLSDYLQSRDNVGLNGVVLLSTILSFDVSDVDGPERNPGSDLPYALALPTYAATAWYHHKLPNAPKELEPFLKQVEQFAMSDYIRALNAGSTLDDATRKAVVAKLHQYTGLPESYIEKANLRINGGEFTKELLGDTDRTAGRLDTRYEGPTMDPLSQGAEYDPQSAAISQAYVALFNHYMRSTLKFGKDMHYRPNNYRGIYSGSGWDMKHQAPGTGYPQDIPNVMPDLAHAMKYNPQLKVLLTGGYFDLATPFYAAIYTMHHLPIEKRLHKNIDIDFLQSGHMVYVHTQALKKLHDRVAKFIKSTTSAE
ncbi:MAG TPA: peptidase S10 [Gammaproteobacteria bacterium]|nr:peptidase S10 [Gammaproteobacteria bacterium]